MTTNPTRRQKTITRLNSWTSEEEALANITYPTYTPQSVPIRPWDGSGEDLTNLLKCNFDTITKRTWYLLLATPTIAIMYVTIFMTVWIGIRIFYLSAYIITLCGLPVNLEDDLIDVEGDIIWFLTRIINYQ